MRNPENLHEHPFFAHFSALELHQLSESLEGRRCAAQQTLFDEDDSSQDFFLLEEGQVQISRMTPFGEFILAQPGPDVVFGAGSLVAGPPRRDRAVFLAPSSVAVFDADALKAVCSRDKKFELALHWSLWKILSRELRQANARLSEFFAADNHLPDTMAPPTAPLGSPDSFDMSTKVGLFREQKLSPMEINFLASLSREERFSPGQVIFHEGEPGTKMYVVAEGRVMISKTIGGIGEEALAFLERGDYFGEMALIDKTQRSADARAHPQTGAVVLALPRDVVEAILDIGKVSSIRLLKLLCGLSAKRVREIHEKLVGWFLLAGGTLEVSDRSVSEL